MIEIVGANDRQNFLNQLNHKVKQGAIVHWETYTATFVPSNDPEMYESWEYYEILIEVKE